jgi:LytS/YehU family sensor histidine kinase
MSVLDALVASMLSVAPAWLLGLGVWWLTGKIPWPARSRPRFFAAHLLLALVYGALWSAVIAWLIATNASRSEFDEYVQKALGWQAVMGCFAYGVVAAVGYITRVSRRLRAEQAAAARAESQRVRAELQAIRAQLDPHFIFNTLHSITALVRGSPPVAEDALERLGRLLRHVLDVSRGASEEVPLGEEWSFVRDYLALEQLRLGDRLRVEEEMDPDAMECIVPAYTLQPLVENAVRHGIAPRARGGTLRLSARLQGDELHLEVRDDGGGADPAAVTDAPGVGVRAVRQRLLTRFPGRARLDVESAAGRGLAVRIVVPAEAARVAAGAAGAAP